MDKTSLIKQVENQELAAKAFGFYWESIAQIMEQIRSECSEIEEAWGRQDLHHVQEEIGDLLQAVIALSVFCGFDTEQTLSRGIKKFEKRFCLMKEIAQKDGHATLHNQTMETLLGYWDRAKKAT